MEATHRRSAARGPSWRLLAALGLLLAVAVSCTVLFVVARSTFDPEARAAAAAERYRQEEQAQRLEGLDIAIAAGWRLLPLLLACGASVVALRVAWARWGATPAVYADKQTAMARALTQRYPAGLQSLALHDSSRRELAAPAMLPELPAPAAAELPGPVDLAALNFTPSRDRILLALGPGGEQITVSVPALCHVALCGATGGGKSNLHRLILPQLLAIGADVVLGDPHFAPIDPENGDDWRPIAQRLHLAPAVKPREIDQLLDWLIEELERRLERRNKGVKVGAPLFLAFDELPVIVDSVKDAPARLGKLLREGRKVGVLTIGASQEFLVKTIGGSSAVRDCYRTAYYVGGDLVSAAALLDIPRRDIDDGPLGGGIALLRSAATRPAQQVRIPLASNAAVYQFLGQTQRRVPSSAYGSADTADRGLEPSAEPRSEPTGSTHQQALNPKADRVRQLLREKVPVTQIVERVWNEKHNTRAGQRAMDELRDILAQLVGGP